MFFMTFVNRLKVAEFFLGFISFVSKLYWQLLYPYFRGYLQITISLTWCGNTLCRKSQSIWLFAHGLVKFYQSSQDNFNLLWVSYGWTTKIHKNPKVISSSAMTSETQSSFVCLSMTQHYQLSLWDRRYFNKYRKLVMWVSQAQIN